MLPQVIATNTVKLIPGRLRIFVEGLKQSSEFAHYICGNLNKVEGIKSVAANPLTGRVLIYFNQQKIDFTQIKGQLDTLRTTFNKPIHDDLPVQQTNNIVVLQTAAMPQAELEETISPKMQIANTIITGGILAGIALKRLFSGRSVLSSSQHLFNVAAITTIISGYPILKRGIAHLLNDKKVNHDLIISTATLALLIMRESITGLSVLWLVQLSGLLNYFAQARSRKFINQLGVAKEYKVHKLQNGALEEVRVDNVAVGDTLVVHAGEIIPVDGKVVAGEATVSHAAVCGEFMPCSKRIGNEVLAGMTVEHGSLQIQAEKVGNNTNIASILSLVEKNSTVYKTMHSGDIYSGKLVPWTIGIALAIFLLTRDVRRSLAVLLAGCPAAIALSANTASGISIAKATKEGILIKDARSLEMAEQIDTVLFDKTGTLTSQCPKVGELFIVDNHMSEEQLLILAASAEQPISHPIASILVEEAKNRGLQLESATSEIRVGLGVEAIVGNNDVLVGNEQLMKQQSIDISQCKLKATRMKHFGNSLLYIAVNQKLTGLIAVKDILRKESMAAIEQLRVAGLENIGLITGDNAYAAETVSKELGITQTWSAALPAEKLKIIKELRQQGRKIMMVGDGINDVPALAAADIGVAMGQCGTHATIKSADMILYGDDPRKAATSIELGKNTMQVIRQNLAFTVGINVIGIGLAAMSLITPVTAVLLQNLSALAVIGNSARLWRGVKSRTQEAPRQMDNIINLQQFAQIQSDKACLPDILHKQLSPSTASQSALWHSIPEGNLCQVLDTSSQFGLNKSAVMLRLKQYGLNALAEGEKASFWKLFIDQFKDFMIQVLIGAAGLSFFLGKTRDAMLTVAIIVCNALLGAIQEGKAEKSLGALTQLAAPTAHVIREGKTIKIKAEELVPGDVIVLEAGDRVPADARLLHTVQFEVEEASLTGETLPVKKEHSAICTEDTPLAERKNMVFMGTSITRGRAYAVVVGTGMHTEMGKIASLIQDHEVEITPLQKKLDELGKYLVYGCLGVSGVVFLAGLLRGERILPMLQTAASLAVAAIPEGLTVIVIIALAMGVQRMAKRNIIVRKMSSIETLGCATVICSDKTGTLTKNEMTVRQVYTSDNIWKLSGEGYTPKGTISCDSMAVEPSIKAALMQTLLGAALCNNAKLIKKRKVQKDGKVIHLEQKGERGWSIHGDPTEGALLVAAAKAGIVEEKIAASYTRVKELPFESERRMMSVICQSIDNSYTLYSKGAPDSIVEKCSYYLDGQQIVPLTPEHKQKIYEMNEKMANQALRVLAVAYKQLQQQDVEDEIKAEQEMIFCGLMGMIDPPRPEVPAAIAKCHKAGVRVIMITGDHPNTASAIGREIGLLQQNSLVLLGHDIDQLSDEQLQEAVEKASICARTSPHHKMRIIKALKAKGYVVVMTGDGVNDAPAVKAADVGIAMGIMGTDVTKDAASMTLADDNFATIVRAMEEGRSIYANIRKAIRYLVATNIGEVALMLLAVLLGLPLPLLPIQLLWLNLVGDGLPAVALVNDPPAKDIMEKKPSSAQDSVFSHGLGRKVLTRGLIIGAVSLAVYAWKLMTTGNLILARTLVLAQLAISQFYHLFDCRIERQAGKVRVFSNGPLVGAVLLSMAMVVGVIQLPALHAIFGTTKLSSMDWLVAFLVSGLTTTLDFSLESTIAKLFPDRQRELQPCMPAPMPA